MPHLSKTCKQIPLKKVLLFLFVKVCAYILYLWQLSQEKAESMFWFFSLLSTLQQFFHTGEK